MARVFTTSFLYNGQTYTALITQVDGSFSIRLMDGSLELVVPQDQLASGYQDQADNEARNLVAAVLAAVDARFNGSKDAPSTRAGDTSR